MSSPGCRASPRSCDLRSSPRTTTAAIASSPEDRPGGRGRPRGRARTSPARPGHQRVRRRRVDLPSPRCCPLRRSHFRTRVWVPACARVGLFGVGFHDLRRTNATILVALGTSIRDAQELLGHDDHRMLLGVYAQATETGKRAAVDGVRAALEPSDGRQRTTSNDGGCAINVPWPPPPTPARCDRSTVAPTLRRTSAGGGEGNRTPG